MSTIRQLRDKTPDSEKITLNLGHVDLGRIDLLVQEGFYSNRSDFIRTAIRNQLDSHGEVVARSIERHMMELGLRDYSRAELEAMREAGEVLHVRVVGLARIAPDVPPIWPAPPSARSPFWAPFRPAPRSARPWPTASADRSPVR